MRMNCYIAIVWARGVYGERLSRVGWLLLQRFFDYCETSYRVFMGGANTFEELDEVLSKQFGKCIDDVTPVLDTFS